MAWNALTQMQPLMRAAGMRELDERGSDLALARAASQRVADALLRGAGGAALPDVVIAPNWFGDTSRSLIAHSSVRARLRLHSARRVHAACAGQVLAWCA